MYVCVSHSINAKIYSKIVSPLIIMGNLRDMGPVPIIANPPKNVDSFEKFAYDFYKSNNEFYKISTEDSDNAENNAVFTGGIYSYSPQTGEKYRDIDGFTTFSKYKILTPLLEVYDRNSIGAVMYNLHSEYHRGKAIDQVIEAWSANILNNFAVTSMIQLVEGKKQRPGAILFFPIAPALHRVRFFRRCGRVLRRCALT